MSIALKIHKSLIKKYFIYEGISRWKRKRNPVDNRRVLLLQFAGLGDAALLAPFVNGIIKKGMIPHIAAPAGLSEFWEYFFPDIRIIKVDLSKAFTGDMKSFAGKHLSDYYEAVFGCSSVPVCAYLAGFSHSDRKAGMIEKGKLFKGARLFYNDIYSTAQNEHVQNRYSSLFKIFDYDIKPMKFDSAACKGESYLCVHPGAKWSPRRWLPEYYVQLFQLIADIRIKVVFGGDVDKDLYRFFKRQVLPNNVELKNTDSLKELIEVVSGCSVFAGADSGPAHTANLLNKRTVVFWGPGNYERVRPIGNNVKIIKKEVSCRPCRQYFLPDTCERGDNVCLKRIKPEEAAEIIKAVLKQKK